MHAHAANATTIAFAISARCKRTRDAVGRRRRAVRLRFSGHRVGELADDQLVQAEVFRIGPLGEGGMQRLRHAQQEPAAVGSVGLGHCIRAAAELPAWKLAGWSRHLTERSAWLP